MPSTFRAADRSSRRFYVWFGIGLAILAGGCSDDGDATPTLPPDTRSPTPEPTPFAPGTEPSPADPSPTQTVTQSQTGVWILSPTGGPYSALTGTLTIVELESGQSTPSCELEFSLTGTVTPSVSGYTNVFEVMHTLLSGDPDSCRAVDLPEDSETWTLGWAPSRQTVDYDYRGTGVWLPWYDAELDPEDSDHLLLSWTRTSGLEEDMQ